MKLNESQLQAVESEALRLLVLAGAGAGKTKTLIQKIEHLVKEYGVSPDKILAITFTRNAADEMIDRLIVANDSTGKYDSEINNKYSTAEEKRELRRKYKNKINWISKLTMTTFHGLCYQMLRSNGAKVYDNKYSLLLDANDVRDQMKEEEVSPENPTSILRRSLHNVATEDQETLLKIKWYLVSLVNKKEKVKTIQYNTHQETYCYTSLNGTKVRSKSEVFIADWLYRHDIAFEYERKVVGKQRSFIPDFYIIEADIFIEHVSELSKGVDAKKEQLLIKKHGVAQTHEYEFYDATGFSQALDNILSKRLGHLKKNLKNLSVTEVFGPYQTELDELIKLMKRVIDLMKVDAQDPNDVFKRGLADEHERVKDFYFILEKVWNDFHAYCKAKSLLDFNDLLINSVKLLKSQNDVREFYQQKYDYILVDEFQDVNDLQVDLLKNLLKPNTQLFCVGDDWQSIYGFRGAVVDYIIDFTKHFPASETIVLNYNYRSTNTIVEAGNQVISNNVYKLDKSIVAFNQDTNIIKLYISNDEKEDGVEYVINRITELNAAGFNSDDILVLARRTAMLDMYRKAARKVDAKASFKTIHSSKGLEALVVFVVGMKEGFGGFPDLWMQDRIFQTIRAQRLDLLLEEERRLFYVAITRARQELNLITQGGSESRFLKEIPPVYLKRLTISHADISESLTCPNCQKFLYQRSKFCPDCGVPI